MSKIVISFLKLISTSSQSSPTNLSPFLDIYENPKARVRVAAAVEKLKKVLSANAMAPINIESLMNDVDVRGMLKREEMEELPGVKALLQRATVPLEQALADAKLKAEDIDFVELVGGCTRVPALKAAIQNFFGKPLNYTMNADEAIARGCAFSCAILSPVFRVRDFSVQDVVNYPIEFAWEKSPDIPDEDTNLTVFNRGNAMPSTKILTFYRKQPFELEAKYAKPEQLPGKINPWIGRFSVKGVKAEGKEDFMICKLKARLNLHGVLNVEQGYYVEEQEIEEPITEEKKDGDVSTIQHLNSVRPAFISSEEEERSLECTATDLRNLRSSPEQDRAAKRSKPNEPLLTNRQAMDTDDKANGEAKAPVKTRKVKKQVRKGDLPLSAGTASLDQAAKDNYMEKEGQMVSEDKLVAETEDKKNELESEIYAMRAKIEEPYESNGYSDFASDEEKEKIRAKCEELEVSLLTRHNMIDCILTIVLRTGFTTTAKMPRRHNTSPSLTNSAHLLAQLSSASTTSDKKRKTHEEGSPKRPQPRSAQKRRQQRRPPRRSGKLRRLQRL